MQNEKTNKEILVSSDNGIDVIDKRKFCYSKNPNIER